MAVSPPPVTLLTNLNISHLNYLLNLVKRFHFPNREWFDLGLSLGLLYDTLTDIQERECRDCLRECFAKWLRLVDTCPTLLKLCDSLVEIGYSDVAQRIRNRNTPELEGIAILKTHQLSFSHCLHTSTTILSLSQSLYSVWCINDITLDSIECMEGSLDDKKTALMTALHETVSINYKKLKVIAQVLSGCTELREIAQILLQDNNKVFSTNQDSISLPVPTCSSDILRTHYIVLYQSLITHRITNDLASVLCSEQVISNETSVLINIGICSMEMKIGVLLKAVRDVVRCDNRKLQIFAVTLRNFGMCVSIADIILSDYRSLYMSDYTSTPISTYATTFTTGSELESLPHILIPRSSSSRFTFIRSKFGDTFYNVLQLIRMNSLTTNDLKEYLEYCCPYLEDRLTTCDSINSILKLVMEKCTLIDIGILENIVKHFNIKEAFRLVDDYWKEIDIFCKDISIELSLNEMFSVTSPHPSLRCETATFVMDWDPTTYTLDDIRNLLSEAFKRLSKLVQVKVLTTGNSIIITCTFPLFLTSSLITEATNNLPILRNKWKLLKLIIGYTTVLERSPDEKEKQDSQTSQLQLMSSCHHTSPCFSSQSVGVINTQQLKDMSLPISVSTYRTKYKALVDCEESEHVRVLQYKCNGVYSIVLVKPMDIPTNRPLEDHIKLFGYIEGLTLTQITYSIQASSQIEIIMNKNPFFTLKARLLDCNIETTTDKLYIGFDEGRTRLFQSFYMRTLGHLPAVVNNVEVKFMVKSSYFNNLRKILDIISDEALNRIIPDVTHFKKGLNLSRIAKSSNPQLNLDEDQFRGLQTMMFTTCTAPVLIPGPFGCGKTRLLAVATHHILTNSLQIHGMKGRVLLCCYQQQSADMIMSQYFKTGSHSNLIFRVISQRHRMNKYHINSDSILSVNDFNETFLICYASMNHIVIVTTFVCAMKMSNVVPNNYFTHIFIDEGAQTREPETLGPLLLANKDTRILIAGDTQQAGPSLSVLGSEPLQHGLGQSLLQRLHSQYIGFGQSPALQYIVTLRHNYRCHKDLLELPSTLFYNSKLIPRPDGVKTHPLSPYPLKFVCSSFDFNYPSSPESQGECLLIIDQVKEFLKCNDFSVNDACVIAASLNQVNLIRRTIYFSDDNLSLRGLNIRTSYDMQGREFSLLFMSTVESLQSNGYPCDVLKSLSHPAVFNTAITRSKSLVVAIGNPLVLMMSEATMKSPVWCWREFIARCLDKDSFIVPFHLKEEYSALKTTFWNILNTRAFIDIKNLQITQVSNDVSKGPSSFVVPVSDSIDSSLPHVPKNSSSSSLSEMPKSSSISIVPKSTSSSLVLKSTLFEVPNSFSSSKVPKSTSSLEPSSSYRDTSLSPETVMDSIPHVAGQTALPIPSDDHSLEVTTQWPDLHHTATPTHNTLPLITLQETTGTVSDTTSVSSHKTESKQLSKVHDKHSSQSIGSSKKNTKDISLSKKGSNSKGNTVQQKKKKSQPSFTERNRTSFTLDEMIPNSVLQKIKKQESQESLKNIERKAFTHTHLPYNEELLKAPLSRNNYREKFHQLLCREEEEHERILNKRCNGIYTVTIFHPGIIPDLRYDRNDNHIRYGLLRGGQLNGDVISYIKQASAERDNIILHLSPGGVKDVVCGVVEGATPRKKGVDVLLIAFTENEFYKMCNVLPIVKKHEKDITDVNVTFVLKWSYFDRLHKGLDQLSDVIINRLCKFDFCQPPLQTFIPRQNRQYDSLLCLDDKGSDNSQMSALRTIMSADCNREPVLIVGSFGTGKTRLLARAAYQILSEYGDHHVLICAHHQHSADTFVANYFSPMHKKGWLKPVRLISQRYYYKYIPGCEEYYTTVNSFQERHGRLVVSTFSTALGLFRRVSRGFFTHILIDEGAQSREPESIIPLCLAGENTQIVIAGDHKQVGPSLLVLGELPNKYGLDKSLLERLHDEYESLIPSSDGYRATLVTNFRCHHAVLSLPSYLFYDSALSASSLAPNYLHPKTTFPLHFICSSLSEELPVEEGLCSVEVELLLQEVNKYVDHWPKVWGETKDLGKIGIIATTPNQKSEILKQLKVYRLSQAEVIVIDTIQGREFEAVFLSTTESITSEGKSINPTKTPCNQYVFNTALTRAKSLVVCIGNPFLLMKVEDHMNNESQCWKDYIRRCIVSRTFSISNKALKQSNKASVENLERIQKEVFPNHSMTSNEELIDPKKGVDSIMKSYRVALRNIPHHKEMKVQINQSKQNWEIVERGKYQPPARTNELIDVNTLVRCELKVHIYNKTEAIPLDTPPDKRRPIIIPRYLDRLGAFDGDIVNVQLLNLQKSNNQECGRVVSVVKAMHQTKYVCRADMYNKITFYPLDKTVPGIVNLPKISKRLLLLYHETQQDDYIPIFSPSSLSLLTKGQGEDTLPQIKELIPFSMSQSLLFIVQVLGWSPRFRKPLGAVIEALPRTSNLFFSERLLKVAHDINDTPNDEVLPSNDPIDNNDESLPHYNRAFTIDSPDTINMDDAISCLPLSENVYELGVHISNVAKFIPEGSKIDESAKLRSTSVYGTSGHAIHMLPISISSQYLTLKCYKTCDVLSVTAKVTVIDGKVISITSNVSEDGPIKAKVTSQAKLTYDIAQKIMNNIPINDQELEYQQQVKHFDATTSNLTMARTLQLVYRIALKLREDRLGCPYPEGDDKEIWQSNILVSEVMIWANSMIASYLYNQLSSTNMALVRRQESPLPDELCHIQSTYGQVLPYSLALERLIKEKEEVKEGNSEEGQDIGELVKSDSQQYKEQDREAINDIEPLLITDSLLSLLHSSYDSQNYNHFLWVLSNDSLYPQLSQAQSVARRINRPAEYIPAAKGGEKYSHCSLNLESYTHFTSPIRRYFDILVQRLLISCIDGTDITYQEEELIELCQQLNKRTKFTNKFEQALKKVKRVQEVQSSLVKVQGFLGECFPNKSNSLYQLLIYDQDKLGTRDEYDTSFDFSHLNINCYDDRRKPQWHIVTADINKSTSYEKLGNFMESIDTSVTDSNSTSLSIFCNIKASVLKYLPNSDGSSQDDVNKLNMKRTDYTAENISTNTYQLEYDAWKIVHQCLKSQSEHDIHKVMEILPKRLPSRESTSLLDKVIEILPKVIPMSESSTLYESLPHSTSPVIIFDIIRSFINGEEFTGWIGKSLNAYIPSTCLQLIEIAPSFHICVQHNRNPSLCFSEIQLQQASKSVYNSMEEYINLWSRVLIAEAANDGVVQTRTLHLLRNVLLKWPKIIEVNNCIDVMHYEPVKNGEISFTIEINKLDVLNYIKIEVGDLICVRYDITGMHQLSSVYHFVVTEKKSNDKIRSKEKTPSPVTIVMKAMNGHCWISEELKPYLGTTTCDLQVIAMPVSFNRVFKRLQKGMLSLMNQSQISSNDVKHRWSQLAQRIALGLIRPSNANNGNDDILESDSFALRLWDANGVLNDIQKEAIYSAIKNCFHLIQGPPGTGKTIVGAHLAYIFSKLKGGCVLYCCPSNKAVDVVHYKLKRLNTKISNQMNQLRIIRLYGRSHEQKDYSNPCYNITQTKGMEQDNTLLDGKCLPELQEDALHYKIRKENDEIERTRKDFIKWGEGGIVPSIEEQNRYNDMIKQTERKVLSEKYDIILCTCNETCSSRMLSISHSITHCIVDECGMAQEPETVAAASLCEHVVLIGDHMQLQPVIKYAQAIECGLSTSLFERYANNNKHLLTQLIVQYRMHETICKVPSDLFYGGNLVTDSSVLSRTPLFLTYPVIIYDVIDDTTEQTEYSVSSHFDIHSKCNRAEAEKVLSVTKMLHEDNKVSYSDIAVLTPYAAQKELLIKMFEEEKKKFDNNPPKVTTIVESQGDEYPVVILTTVRSLPSDDIKDERLVQPDRKWMMENLGFLTNTHQMNVAITRAKHGLILIGNVTLLRYVDSWKQFIDRHSLDEQDAKINV